MPVAALSSKEGYDEGKHNWAHEAHTKALLKVCDQAHTLVVHEQAGVSVTSSRTV